MGIAGSTSNPKPAPRAAGLVFIPFFLIGAFFTVMVLRDAIASAATFTWQSVPCRIAESEVRESTYPAPWFAYLRYTWSTGESVRSSRPFGTYREAARFTRRWPAGSGATCYLDPRDPAGALLEPKGAGLVLLLFLPIPLFFVFIGAAGFHSIVFRVQPKPRVWHSPWHAASPLTGRRFLAALLILPGLGFVPGVSIGTRAPRHRSTLVAHRRVQNPSQRSPADRHQRRQRSLFSADPLLVRGG